VQRFRHSKRQVELANADATACNALASTAAAAPPKMVAAGGSAINWSMGDQMLPEKQRLEVTVLGRKQGFSAKKKAAANPKARSRLCKAALFAQFGAAAIAVGSASSSPMQPARSEAAAGRDSADYTAAKAAATDYQLCKQLLLSWRDFHGWVGNGTAHAQFSFDHPK
jgi:hypothetical protein